MRKAYDTENSGILEIKPIDEIVVPEGIPEPIKNSFKHEEVFINKKIKSRMELIQEEDINHDEQIMHDEEEPIVPVKKGRGKRGKDKKPRVKKPPTEKQLAHLAKIRLLSKQRREAKKLEKERIKLEITKKAEESTKKSAKIKAPVINKRADSRKTQVVEETEKVNYNQNNINPTNISAGQSMEQFFSLMEKYEEYKEKKVKVKKAIPKPQSLPSGRTIDRKYRPAAPNPLINEPKNPFDICFSYGKNW